MKIAIFALMAVLGLGSVPAEETRPSTLGDCVMLDAYYDGDSFHVYHEATKTRFVVRLDWIDAPETDMRYPDRVRKQMEHFDLESERAVLAKGEEAKEFTRKFLEGKEFTVTTQWKDAGGDGAKRYYGRVAVDGADLGDALVEAGLARRTGKAALKADAVKPKKPVKRERPSNLIPR